VTQSHVFAGVGGYFGGTEGHLAGIFRRAAGSSEWLHVLTKPEAYTVFVHPADPKLVFAGTTDGVYRSTDAGATFKRSDFPDSGVQIWSFLADPTDPRRLLAGGSPVSIYRSEDAGESWKRMPEPKLPERVKAPFASRVMRFARHPGRPNEIYAALEFGGVIRSTDGGENWSDCSGHLIRLSEQEPRLRSKIVTDTESEGMLDGHALCVSAAEPDSVILALTHGPVPQQGPGQELGGPAGRPLLAVHIRRDIKVSPQDPRTLYACLSVAAASKDGALYRSQDIGQTWQRFDKVKPHGTLMSVSLHHGDPNKSMSRRATARCSAPGRRRELARDAAAAGRAAHLRAGVRVATILRGEVSPDTSRSPCGLGERGLPIVWLLEVCIGWRRLSLPAGIREEYFC
jgi:hypothetical protein